jgi:hypothetical protein
MQDISLNEEQTQRATNSTDGNANSFTWRQSMSIHNAIPETENDIWVQWIVLGGTSKQGSQTYFKSLYSNEHGMEPPPTEGAMTIIYYLEDMIERKNTPKQEQVQPNQTPRGK